MMKKGIRIENKNTGEIIQTDISLWRYNLSCIKSSSRHWENLNITTKPIALINGIMRNNRYEDQYIKAEFAEAWV
jgi:hypothetical protein